MTDTQRIREKHERWKDAPEWAEWCAIHDGDGSIRWLRQKPDIEGNPDYDFEPRPHPDEIALMERVDALENAHELNAYQHRPKSSTDNNGNSHHCVWRQRFEAVKERSKAALEQP